MLERGGGAAVAFVVKEEEGFGVTVVDVRDKDGTAERAAEGVEVLGRFAGEAVGICIEGAVLEVFKEAAMERVAAAARGDPCSR